MQNFPKYFLLVLLLNGISVNSYNVTEENEVISTLEPRNHLVKEATFPAPKTLDTNEFVGEKIPVNHTLQAKHNESGKNNNTGLETVPRVSRDATKEPRKRLECISCYGSGTTTHDDDCYKGKTIGKVNCADSEACYTELHPQYIKRGCILPSRINRTFVCKCPLCNDKPAADSTYYDYKSLNDWQFDNEHLGEPMTGLDLLCKVCETTGQNHISDQICRNGSGTNYMLCGTNQLCFTNIIPEKAFVSRGCTAPPAFNTIKFYCTNANCNTEPYDNPSRNKRSIAYKLLQSDPNKNNLVKKVRSNANQYIVNSGVFSAFPAFVLGRSFHSN